MLSEALDRAALAGRIAPFEDDHHARARLLHPVLQLEQLDLLLAFDAVVFGPGHTRGVRKILAPRFEAMTGRPDEVGLAVQVVLDAIVPKLVEQVGGGIRHAHLPIIS